MRLSSILYNSWDLMVSVALSRSQVLAPLMSDVERRFHNLQMEEEREKSLLCDFELKSIQDDKLIAKREELERSGKDLSELEEQIGVINATIEDGWSRKGEQLMAKLRICNDSARDVNDEHSLQRMLDRKLLLIVQQRFEQNGYKSPWILPQIKHVSGESLRDVCFHLAVPVFYFIRGFRYTTTQLTRSNTSTVQTER
uniref:MRP-L46 domain-containing protein n=1 Tax=Angiostrongylus cantonensis TaxID=6313 RepID=A0A0K0D4T2_ANGCA